MSVSTIPVSTSVNALSLSVLGSQMPIINPNSNIVREDTRAFIFEHNIEFPSFSAINTMAGYLYPQADRESLLSINMLMGALFYLDDTYGDLVNTRAYDPAALNDAHQIITLTNA